MKTNIKFLRNKNTQKEDWITLLSYKKENNLIYRILIVIAIIWLVMVWLWEDVNWGSNEYKVNKEAPNLQTSVKWGKYNQAVTWYTTQINEMINRWYSKTRILDLLAFKSMECNSYKWDCIWIKANDVWPFQINKIHREQYDDSLALIKSKEWAVLYRYQLRYANQLVESYMQRFCKWEYAKTNKKRFQCVAVSYNWHPRYKHTYKQIAWEKRKIIKKHLNLYFN